MADILGCNVGYKVTNRTAFARLIDRQVLLYSLDDQKAQNTVAGVDCKLVRLISLFALPLIPHRI